MFQKIFRSLISPSAHGNWPQMAWWQAPWLAQWRLVGMILLSSLLLSGCVKSDIGIAFDSPTQGVIVQHIRFGDQVTRLNASTIQVLLDQLNDRTKPLGGTVRRRDRAATVTIPFSNSQDLVTKFNRFLSAAPTARPRKVSLELPKITSQLKVEQGNFILVERRRLIYDLDLRSLGISSADGDALVNANALLELEFSLKTPWGARNLTNLAGRPTLRQQGTQLVWALQPGQINHVEAVFWLPSPIGLGSLVIGLLVGGGIYVKRNATVTADVAADVAASASH